MNYYLIKIVLLMMTAISSTTTANTIDGVKSGATSSPISFTLPRGGYSAFLKKKEATSTYKHISTKHKHIMGRFAERRQNRR